MPGRRLTRELVRAAHARMEAARGGLTVRRALLLDPADGVSDRDIAGWLERGDKLRREGATSQDATLSVHDRLCVRLSELDSSRGIGMIIMAGEALEHVLTDRSPKTAGPRVRAAIHVQKTLAPDAMAPERVEVTIAGQGKAAGDLLFAQHEIDALCNDDLARFEELARERARIADEMRALVEQAVALQREPTMH